MLGGGGDVEVLFKENAVHEACPLLGANDVAGSVKVVGQTALIGAVCKTRVPGKDLDLVSQTPAVLMRAKSSSMRATRRHLQELRRWLPVSKEVSNQSSMSACRARQLSAPPVKPVLVVLPEASKGVVDAESKRAVNRPKPRAHSRYPSQETTESLVAG